MPTSDTMGQRGDPTAPSTSAMTSIRCSKALPTTRPDPHRTSSPSPPSPQKQQLIFRGSSSSQGQSRESASKTSGHQVTMASFSQIPRDSVSAPATPNQRTDQGDVPQNCCYFFCCCCPSSWCVKMQRTVLNLTVPTSQNKEPTSNASAEIVDERITADDLRSWETSFDKVMKSKAGQKIFGEFLKSEFSDENILFWLAVEDLRKEQNPEKVQECARLIYEDYISILSPKEVSLDSRVRDTINNDMLRPSCRMFDEAQLQIYTLMRRDSYPRFLNSPAFKTLLKQCDVAHQPYQQQQRQEQSTSSVPS